MAMETAEFVPSKRTQLFDFIRRMTGRGFSAAEVKDLDARMDAMVKQESMPPEPLDVAIPVLDEAPITKALPERYSNLKAAKITKADIAWGARELNVSAAHIRAILKVESRGKGFDTKGRPIILYEPHVFHRRTKGRWSPTSWSYRKWRTKPYPRSYDARWQQMAKAARVNLQAALESASVGLFQIMGFHWKSLGYASVEQFYECMAQSEGEQLKAVVRFIKVNGLAGKLRQCVKGNPDSCRPFVRGYNGPSYASNNYHVKFARAL